MVSALTLATRSRHSADRLFAASLSIDAHVAVHLLRMLDADG